MPGTQKLAWHQKLLYASSQSQATIPATKISRAIHDQWASSWIVQRDKVPPDKRAAAHMWDDSLKDPYLYDNLSKAESSLATQLRTEKMGLNVFLAQQRVPGIAPSCTCKYSSQTVKHVILFCPYIDCSSVHFGLSTDLKCILTNPDSLRKVGRWLMGLNILPQFRLAYELLGDVTQYTDVGHESAPNRFRVGTPS
jgi:hypothetical protein